MPEAPLPFVDACDCPAVVLATDADVALELRAVLQSLGFDVLCGATHLDGEDEPVLVVQSNFLDQPDNRERFDRVREIWPSAKVVPVSHPADAAVQLIPMLS